MISELHSEHSNKKGTNQMTQLMIRHNFDDSQHNTLQHSPSQIHLCVSHHDIIVADKIIITKFYHVYFIWI